MSAEREPSFAALGLRVRLWRIRVRWAFSRWFRPMLLHPDEMSSYDGEPPWFLRADLASTPEQVVAYFRESWGNEAVESTLAYSPVENIDRVLMRESDEKHPETDEPGGVYSVVPEAVAGAVPYWRWSE